MDEKETVYMLLLECTSSKEGYCPTRKLHFSSPPRTIADIKVQIQKDCQIPVTLQTILLSSNSLDSNIDLSTLRLRNYDTLTVRYFSTAQCNELDECISWLRSVVETFTKFGVPGNCTSSLALHPAVQNIMNEDEDFISNLALELFLPWMEPEMYANKMYFISNHGLDSLIELHSLLLSHQWNNLPLKLQIKQCEILCALWNLSETFHLRREILKRGGLDKCLQSLVQVRIEPLAEKFLEDEPDNLDVLCENIKSAIGTLSNLCELPETHLQLAMNREAIDQMINVATSNIFDLWTVTSVAILLLVLSYTSDTHSYLLSYRTIENLMCVEYKDDQGLHLQTKGSPLLMNYHRATYFAQLFLVSFSCFTKQQAEIVEACVSQFVTSTTPDELREAELDEQYVWETFLPYVKLFYLPQTSSRVPDEVIIQRDCLHVILIALENMLGRENHRHILKCEGNLLDYVVCIPWHVSEDLRGPAQRLVRMIQLSPEVELQPPSLTNIAKATVAKSFCGLEQVFRLSVPELVRKLC